MEELPVHWFSLGPDANIVKSLDCVVILWFSLKLFRAYATLSTVVEGIRSRLLWYYWTVLS